MKRILFLIVAALVFILLMSAFAPFYAVTIPDELQAVIASFVTLLITGLLKVVGGWLKINIENWAAIITAGIVSAIVAFLNALLSGVPAPFEELANLVLRMVVILFSSMGMFGLYRQAYKKRAKGIG